MNIKENRRLIDSIDKAIIKLLEDRMDVASEIAENKAALGLPVRDPAREEEKLEQIKECSDEKYVKANLKVFQTIIEESCKFQESHPMQYGLLGQKVSHSFSPEIHKAMGGYDYGLFNVEPEDLEGFFKKVPFEGINVTIPYKKKAMEFCQKVSEKAKKIGCVNTIVRNEDGTLSGYNTDYYGFKKLFDHVLEELGEDQIQRDKDKVLILGSGGASLAVQSVLADEKFGNVMTISRSREDNYTNLDKHFDAKIIINATPVGTYPDNNRWPLEGAEEAGILKSLDDFSQCKAIVDLIYNPINTKLLSEGKKRGMVCCGGLEMLVAQALKAIEIFTGKSFTPVEEALCLERLEKKNKNIILIGMPGAGKSTIGERLAIATGRPFVDLDDEIFYITGDSAESIIDREGEEFFREMETQALDQVMSDQGQVIATGGGVVTNEENLKLMNQNSIIIYLERDLEDLEIEGRPLSLEKGVAKLFEERENLYKSWSNVTIKADDEAMVVDAIKNIIEV